VRTPLFFPPACGRVGWTLSAGFVRSSSVRSPTAPTAGRPDARRSTVAAAGPPQAEPGRSRVAAR
jgi:hypothetical protein